MGDRKMFGAMVPENTKKYRAFPFLYTLPETSALNRKKGHKP